MRRLYLIADAHLGVKPQDHQGMIDFIQGLDPLDSELIFLGDLFHVWAGPKRFHTLIVSEFLNSLAAFSEQGGISRLVVGNRDALFSKHLATHRKGLPFAEIALKSLSLEQGEKKILVFHGDTINQDDKSYLRWRSMIRSGWFSALFRLLPAFFVKRLMLKLEAGLKGVNLQFKKDFPQQNFEDFIQALAQQKSPDLVLIGHFHPSKPIYCKQGKTLGVVVPDWMEGQNYGRLDPSGELVFLRFKA